MKKDTQRNILALIVLVGTAAVTFAAETPQDAATGLDLARFEPTLSTVGSAGRDPYMSLAIGNDGLGLFSYYLNSSNELRVAHCNDASCTSADLSKIDGGKGSGGSIGWYTSLVIGNDGLGLISYFNVNMSYGQTATRKLKVAHCNDASCTSATIASLDSVYYVNSGGTSIAIGADGLGLICYEMNGLRVAHCNDANCTSAAITMLDKGQYVGWDSSIAIGADGLGLISYYDQSNGGLKVAHCNDANCTSATLSTLDSAGRVGRYTSIAIGSDGLGLISYYDKANKDLKVAHCNDASCTSAAITTIDSAGDVGRYTTAVTIGSDGLGLISYYDKTNKDLKLAHCNDASCTSATTSTLDSTGDVGRRNSIAIGSDGLGLISYYDKTNKNLKVAHLSPAD